MTGVAAEEPQSYKHSHEHRHTDKKKKKKKKILQVALVTEAIVASLSAQTLTFI